GQQTTGHSSDKRQGVAASQVKQSTTTPGPKRSAQVRTEVNDHKNDPQVRPVKQGYRLGGNRDTTGALREAVDEYKGVQRPVRRRLAEQQQHGKARDGAAHGHAKGAFAVQPVGQPAKEHAAPQTDQAHSTGNGRGAQELEPARTDQKRHEMDID